MNLTGGSLRKQRESMGLSQAKLAELTGLPQHKLSAFELGKLDLSRDLLDFIVQAISDESATQALSARAKRYRNHEYRRTPHLAERVARAHRTPGNPDYLLELETLGRVH